MTDEQLERGIELIKEMLAQPPRLCSTFISRGTSKTSSFRNTAGWFRITFSIALRPPRISRMVSAFSA
jgi:hypothetical protein